MTVGVSTIKQTLSTQGIVESMNRGEYRIFDGVVVKEVHVKLGDKVDVMLVNGGQPVYYFIISVE